MRIYGRLGETQQSIPVAQRLLELEPENADALDRLGRWYAVQGDFENLAAIVARLNQIKQRTPRQSLLLGDLEFERRQYPAAFRAYRQASTGGDFDKATQARMHYRLGEMYLVADDTYEALHAFQASVATGADIHELHLARTRIDQIRPPLPPSATRSANETLRAMAGPLLLVWLTGAIQVGLRFGNLNAAALVGLFAAVPGSYLLASVVSTPTAIEWRTLMGAKGLTQPVFGAIVALLGGAILVTSVVLILFGA
jgi:tetratricopeptide (TPR) repeat protein